MVFSKCHARLTVPPLRLLPPSIYPFFCVRLVAAIYCYAFFLPRALFTSAIDRHAATAAAARSLSAILSFLSFFHSSRRICMRARRRVALLIPAHPSAAHLQSCIICSCLFGARLYSPISRASSVHHEAATQLTFSNSLSHCSLFIALHRQQQASAAADGSLGRDCSSPTRTPVIPAPVVACSVVRRLDVCTPFVLVTGCPGPPHCLLMVHLVQRVGRSDRSIMAIIVSVRPLSAAAAGPPLASAVRPSATTRPHSHTQLSSAIAAIPTETARVSNTCTGGVRLDGVRSLVA